MDDRPVMARLFEVTMRQDHCISAAQLRAIGIASGLTRSLVTRGVLHRSTTGAYVVGAAQLTDRQLLRTAVLVGGRAAGASHWSAAGIYSFAEVNPGEAWVTVPGRRVERTVRTLLPVSSTGRAGTIRVIGSRRPAALTVVDGIPTVSAERAMVGIAGRGTQELVTAAWREADFRNRLRREAIERELGSGVAGTVLIRSLLASWPLVNDDETRLVTRAEYLLLAAVLAAGVPRPLVNAPLRLAGVTYYPDQLHPDVGLVVECDGGVHHRSARRASDAARDAHMRAHGLSVMRFPNEQIERDAAACAREIVARRAGLLAARSAA